MSSYLIWDFDGTLGYRQGAWSGALYQVLRDASPEAGIGSDQLRPFLRTGFPWHNSDKSHTEIKNSSEWWNRLNPVFSNAFRETTGCDSQTARDLALRVREAYLDPAYWHLYDDVVPALSLLSQRNWKHVILSNHVPELRSILTSLNIPHFFEQVFNSAETGYEKPNPQAFEQVLQSIKRENKVLMIGDSFETDINGARQSGVDGILVRNYRSEAEKFCETLADLPDILG